MKKYLAEFIGTFLLAFSVLVSTGLITRIGTPALAALVLGFCVYTLGMVSGAHLNPAITLAVFSVRKIGVQDALGYIIAQLAGAGLAAALAGGFIISPMNPLVKNTSIVGLAELIGAFVLAFGVSAVIEKKASQSLSGVVIGGAFLIGISVASTVSLGLLNPAVALVFGARNVMYLVGPIVGAVLAMWLYRALIGLKEEK